MGFKEYVAKLFDGYDKSDVNRHPERQQNKTYLERAILHGNLKDKYDRFIEEVFSLLKPEDYIAINKEIYGESFEKNTNKIALDSNAKRICDDFKDDPSLFDICDKEALERSDSIKEDYAKFLSGIFNQFISKGKSDEEILNDPMLLVYLYECRQMNKLSFLPREDQKGITEGNREEKLRRDKDILKSALKNARTYMTSPKALELHPERVGNIVHFGNEKYGIKKIELFDYNKMVLDKVDQYIDSKKLDAIADKYEKEKNISECIGLEATVKHPLYPKIQEYIKDINDGKIAVPEGVTKEELLLALNYAGENLTAPEERAFDFANSVSGKIDSHNQYKEAADTYNGLKTFEDGKYYQLYEKDEENERNVLNGSNINTNVGNVTQGKENLIDDYTKIKPEFSKEYIDTLDKIFKKFDQMGMYSGGPLVEEEGIKLYSLKKLAVARNHLIEAIEKGNLKDVPKASKEFEKEHKNMEELYALAKQTGSSTFPANLGTERNAAVPFEFSSDYQTTALLNSYYILYNYLKQNNLTIQEYAKDPAKYVTRDLMNLFETEGANAIAKQSVKEKGLAHGKARAISAFNDTSRMNSISRKQFALAQSAGGRGYSSLVDGEPDESKKTKNLIALNMANSISGENAVFREMAVMDDMFEKDEGLLQNYLLAREEDIDLYKLKTKDYYDHRGAKVKNDPRFNPQRYILEKDISAKNLYDESIETLARMGEIYQEADVFGFSAEKNIVKPMLAIMKNFTEYLIAHPEAAKTSIGKKMIDFIKDPEEAINDGACLGKYGDGVTYELSDESQNQVEALQNEFVERLKEAKEIKGDYKKLVEDPVKKSETEFNKIAKNMIKNIDNLLKKVSKGVDVDKNTELLLKEQNKYKLFAADRTMELMDRYKKGLLPEEYVKNRVKDINSMNIKDEKVDIFKYSTPKEKLLFEEEYRRRVTSPTPMEKELPKDIEFGDLAMTNVDSSDGKLVGDFTQKEQEFINKSYNKSFYDKPEELSEKYFEALGIKDKEEANPIVAEENQARVQIQIDLADQNREERKSLPIQKGATKDLENVKVEEAKGRNSI